MPTNPPHAPTPALSHVTDDGAARMVDVGDKPVTQRSATAEGFVRVSHELAAAIEANAISKGSVLEVSRLAGILAAKRTDELIPLCHMLPLDAVDVSTALEPATTTNTPRRVRVVAAVRTRSRTGVEMEALTAVCVACLTVIDMGKAIDKAMVIEGVRVLEKHGGRYGSYVAPGATSETVAGGRQ
ncbi:MAG: cyclic pyranopterin monophosphate synthase MoaC [Phycisphaeraceae bacterium]|nr:MAG: cyclic pyranopterin monophosphate synthase MoaC [Phycisphaeraceae bacterium]